MGTTIRLGVASTAAWEESDDEGARHPLRRCARCSEEGLGHPIKCSISTDYVLAGLPEGVPRDIGRLPFHAFIKLRAGLVRTPQNEFYLCAACQNYVERLVYIMIDEGFRTYVSCGWLYLVFSIDAEKLLEYEDERHRRFLASAS